MRRDLRSVEPGNSGSNPTPVSHLRSDPSTLVARQPDPFAGARKRRQPWLKQAVVSVLQTGDTPPRRRHGVLEPSHRGGEHGTAGSAPSARSNRSRALHSAELGPCCPEKQFTGLLPSTEAARYQALPSSPRKRRRPREGYAERVVRRHGSLASSPHRTRMPVVPVPDGGLPTAPDERSSHRMETSVAGERGGGSLARGVGFLAQARAPNADRGGSLARRRIHGSRACPRVDHALQRSVGSRKPREARVKARSP